MEITKEQIRQAADSRSWQRGVDYHRDGRVISLLERKETIVGKVSGTRNYNVRLYLSDGELDGSCDCPIGEAGVFCKHCVALGLSYLDGAPASATSSTGKDATKKARPAITMEDVQQYLAQQPSDVLVEIIADQMCNDDALRERLLLKTARFKQQGVDLTTFRQIIDQATTTHGFVDYQSARGFAARIGQVIDSVQDLLCEGYADEVIELSEYALGRVEEALGEMDDSDGYMGDLLDRLQQIHHQACAQTKPDPEALAKRLFEWELASDWDTFHGAVETYADVLGKKGRARYRRLAEAEWAKLPALKHGQTEDGYHGRRHRLAMIMEAIARIDGDVEYLVAIKSKDLSSAYRFLEIAKIYKDAGNSESALEWAEKGFKAFGKDTDSRLRGFLADEYHRRRRHDEAMQLIWANFTGRPYLENYKALKEHAERIKDWAGWRQQALGYIRSLIGDTKKQKPDTYAFRVGDGDHSRLVEIFLWEKDAEAAWREAQIGGCHDSLWMELARLREKEYPADAIGVYQRLVEPIIQRTNNQAYREAILLIKKIAGLMKRLDRERQFGEYVDSLDVKYKAKRNFIKLLSKLQSRGTTS